MTVPLPTRGLREHREWMRELADLGYTDLWSSEAAGCDAFTPLLMSAAWELPFRLGTAIVPVATRGPAVLAQTAAALSELSGGRFVLGIGASSPMIVEQWNARSHDESYWQVHDTIAFLRRAFEGERVTESYRTFAVEGFQLARRSTVPPVMLAALGPAMIRLAATRADGIILNWLSPGDVPELLAGSSHDEVVCRIMVCCSEDSAAVRDAARPLVAAYLSVPGYAALYRRLGHGEQLSEVWRLWELGQRKQAARAVPDELVDAVVIHGSASRCRERVEQYVAAGVTTPVLAPVPFGQDPQQTARELRLT